MVIHTLIKTILIKITLINTTKIKIEKAKKAPFQCHPLAQISLITSLTLTLLACGQTGVLFYPQPPESIAAQAIKPVQTDNSASSPDSHSASVPETAAEEAEQEAKNTKRVIQPSK